MASSHEEYKAQKRAEAEAKALSHQRQYAVSGKTKAERASIQLTPAEEFSALWVGVSAQKHIVHRSVRKTPIVAYAFAALITFIYPSAFLGVFAFAVVVHALSLVLFYPELSKTRDSMKDLAAAAEMPNPEFDRKGKRLKDAPRDTPWVQQ